MLFTVYALFLLLWGRLAFFFFLLFLVVLLLYGTRHVFQRLVRALSLANRKHERASFC